MNKFIFIIYIFLSGFSLFCTEVVFLSDEGWCEIYLDDTNAGKIPLNDHKTVLQVKPGNYVLKITDSFKKIWYNNEIEIPNVDKITIQIEPDFFEIVSIEGNNPSDLTDSGKPEINVSSYSFRKLKSLLHIISDKDGLEIFLNKKFYGYTPFAIVDIEPAEYELMVKADGKILLNNTLLVKKGEVTRFFIKINKN